MSIISGIATAPGISALLNAPRERNVSLEATSTESRSRGNSEGETQTARVLGTRPGQAVTGVDRAAIAQASLSRETTNDPRLARFVDAVQALRLNADTASDLTPGRISELRAAAKEVFEYTGEIPRDVRPTDTAPEPPKAAAVPEKSPPRKDSTETAPPDQPEPQATAQGETLEPVFSKPDIPEPVISEPAAQEKPATPETATTAEEAPVPADSATDAPEGQEKAETEVA